MLYVGAILWVLGSTFYLEQSKFPTLEACEYYGVEQAAKILNKGGQWIVGFCVEEEGSSS